MTTQFERDVDPIEKKGDDASSKLFADVMPQLKIENNNNVQKDACTPDEGAEEGFMESKACAEKRLGAAEKDMDEAYKNAEEHFAEPLKSKLVESQETWKKFYESQSKMMEFIYENSENIDPAAGVKERIKILQERTEELKKISEIP